VRQMLGVDTRSAETQLVEHVMLLQLSVTRPLSGSAIR
jgi:hypothetical protein